MDIAIALEKRTSRPARPALCVADDFVMSLVKRVSKPKLFVNPLDDSMNI